MLTAGLVQVARYLGPDGCRAYRAKANNVLSCRISAAAALECAKQEGLTLAVTSIGFESKATATSTGLQGVQVTHQ